MTAGWLVLPCCFAIAWLATRWVLSRAVQLQLVQSPSHRSSHVLPTPTGGGLGMAIATTLAGGWLVATQGLPLYPLLLALALVISGLLDDRGHLPAMLRFAVQLCAVAALLALLDELPSIPLPWLGAVSGWLLGLALLLAGVWWINLFNFMDGIDGIAGVQTVSMLAAAAGLAAWQTPAATGDALWLFALCLAASILGFLVLNWSPARIFMGDVGSTWLAFMVFAVALMTVQRGWFNYGFWLVLASVFVIDATVTLLTRMVRGERWYEAHRSHAYQRLSRYWGHDRKTGHRAVALLVLAVNLLWLVPLAAAMLKLPEYAGLWLAAAWLPLIAAVLYLGAGRPDNDHQGHAPV